MVISFDFRMGEHRDTDNQEDAPHFINLETSIIAWKNNFEHGNTFQLGNMGHVTRLMIWKHP